MKPPKTSPAKPRPPRTHRPAVAAASEHAPTPEAVAARLLALAPRGELPALWSRAELARRLTAAERPALDAALARLQADRQVLALRQGKSAVWVFAGPLRGWLDGSAVVEEAAGPLERATLDNAYQQLVRESGGFPDVKISALKAALGPAAAGGTLAAELVACWRRGEGTLSLGDWSLASEETRAAAVELNGEKYLLVRLEIL